MPFATAKTLSEYQVIYKNAVAGIETEHKASIAATHQSYLTSIDAGIAEAKQKGDLSGYKRLIAEKERFGFEETIPTGPFAVHLVTAALSRNEKLEGLTQRYIAALTQLRAVHMQADDIAQAERVDAEVKKVEFSLAVLPQPEPEPQPEPDVDVPPRRTGLFLHYNFDRQTGADVSDRSGEGHHGQNNGARLRRASSGSCFFNGRASLQTAATARTEADFGELSFALWVKPEDGSGTQQLIARTDQLASYQTPGGVGLDMNLHGPFVPGFHFNDQADRRISFGKPIPARKWTHLAAVLHSDGSAVLYINGTAVARQAGFGRIPALPGSFIRVGQWASATYPFYYRGCVDDVMVLDRALTSAEVGKLYSSQGYYVRLFTPETQPAASFSGSGFRSSGRAVRRVGE